MYNQDEYCQNDPRYELNTNISCWISDCDNEQFTFDDLTRSGSKGDSMVIAGAILLPIACNINFRVSTRIFEYS